MVKYICNDCLDPDPCEIIVADGSDVPSCCPFRLTWKAVNWHEAAENLQPDLQDKPLPKLTAEVFDRPDCPEWAKYAAVREDGIAIWFEVKPNIGRDYPASKFWYSTWNSKNIPGEWDASDWQNSLIERPAKLPNWCKQGELIYTSSEQYLKINGISIDLQKIELSNGATWSKQDIIDEAVPARLRPYNAEEMKALVGKVIEKGPSMHIVTGFENVFGNECVVHANGCLYSANDLLRQFTIDNALCGVLEHLENGEWVQ